MANVMIEGATIEGAVTRRRLCMSARPLSYPATCSPAHSHICISVCAPARCSVHSPVCPLMHSSFFLAAGTLNNTYTLSYWYSSILHFRDVVGSHVSTLSDLPCYVLLVCCHRRRFTRRSPVGSIRSPTPACGVQPPHGQCFVTAVTLCT